MIVRDYPSLALLGAARAVSALGNGMTLVALVLFVADDGPGAVAGLLLAGTLPRLAGPLAGAVADRAPVRSVLAGCWVANGACIAAIALLDPPFVQLCLLVAVAAALDTVASTAARAAVVDVVPADRLGEANAWLTAGSTATMLAGGALGGVLVAAAGVRTALLIDVATFVLASGLVRRLPLVRISSMPAGGVWSGTAAGLRHARADPGVRGLALGTFLLVAFLGVDNVALVFLVRDELGGGAAAYGVIQAVYGGGLLLGSVALARLHRPAATWLVGGVLLGAVGTVATGLAPVIAVVVAGQVLGGVGNALSLIGSDTLVQQVAPREILARIGGLVGTSAQLGLVTAYAASAPLLSAIGPRGVFVVAGFGSLTALIALRPTLSRM